MGIQTVVPTRVGVNLGKIDASGKVFGCYVPDGTVLPDAGYPVADTLPAIYDLRKGNRGCEGRALSGDEQTLSAVLQSPLLNPDDETGEASRVGRILAIATATGQPPAAYVYPFEAAPEFDPALEEGDQDEMKLSGLVSLGDTTLVVLERTDEVVRLYSVDLSAATDVLGTKWDDLTTSPTLESLADLTASGIDPLAKSPLIDLDSIPIMPDKKGVAVIDEQTLAVINDNDVDIGTFDDSGRHQGEGTQSQLLLIQTSSVFLHHLDVASRMLEPAPGVCGVQWRWLVFAWTARCNHIDGTRRPGSLVTGVATSVTGAGSAAATDSRFPGTTPLPTT